MEGIFILKVDEILYVLQYLDTQDRIAFAYSCERFREICMDERVFRKLNLSDRRILRRQQTAINEFFRDKQMVKHIRELRLNNHRVRNWKMNDHLEEFIMSICPHLEALHVLNCGINLETLHRMLKQAPKLTSLSWSFQDLKPGKDINFLMNGMKSSDAMCLKNIKHLRLEILDIKPHIEILNYLVLSHCKYVEELEIYKRETNETLFFQLNPEFERNCVIPAFPPQPSTSISDALPHLHSLILAEFGNPLYSSSLHTTELSDFVHSVVRRKSSETKWKKLWIAPPTDSDILHAISHLTASSVTLPKKHLNELYSVEAFTAHVGPSLDAVDGFKTLFQKIGDNTVKNLHLSLSSSQNNLILEICKPILRTGGLTLKSLSLFVDLTHFKDAETNLFFNTLFSGCLNIKDLDLLNCHFEDNICEALCKLKFLDKIQLQECAMFAKHNENQEEITKGSLFTFVENCQNIRELDVRGCYPDHEFTSRNIDDDLMALAKLTKLRSLTLYEVSGIKQWTFLQNISTHCKFLSMLRISAWRYFDKSCIPIILESAKFLKHFAITVTEIDLGLEDTWKLLCRATKLERLCIVSKCIGSPNVFGAIEMIKSLPRLHVLHLHSFHVENIKFFYDEIAKTLKAEESDYSVCFELLGQSFESPSMILLASGALPLNSIELCLMRPILAIPTL